MRWYRRRILPKLGNRCVFEPSCSHYAELALREKGLVKGLKLTAKRLCRCRPGAGGIDLP
ncbi:MAG: membrane protein insertion efficiency factor YidD [Elusimicrobiota bacterium]